MKSSRQEKILEIIASRDIETQGQLIEVLSACGVKSTQATLSRDLVELRATKVRSAGGTQVYAIPEAGAPGQIHVGSAPLPGSAQAVHTTTRLARWCADLLVTAEHAGPQVVLRTPAGAAQLLASAVDDAMLPGVLGCIAGDDTVLVITRDENVSAQVEDHLLALADPSSRR